MNTSDWITLIAAGLAFVASVGAVAVVAYHGRFRRFTSERWWQIRVEAYTRIIESLTHLVHYYDQLYEAELEKREIPAERRVEVQRHWREADMELKRATAAGTFKVSAEVAEALQAMGNTKGRYEGIEYHDWVRRLDADYAAARDCLRAVVAAAHKDLGVSNRVF